MAALLILFLFGLYLWITYKLVRRARPAWTKALIVLAAVLIPTADAIYGRMKLRQMCEAEGGLHIYKTVEGAEGFRYGRSRPETEWITKFGYKFIEGEALNGKPARLTKMDDGTVRLDENVTPIAQYAFEKEGKDLGLGYGYGEYRIIRIQSGEKLSVYQNFSYAGGWVERAIAGMYASKGFVGDCGNGDSWQITLRLIQTTLKPIN